MISYLPFPQKSIRSELAKLFSISIYEVSSDFIQQIRGKRHRRMNELTNKLTDKLTKCQTDGWTEQKLYPSTFEE